MGNSTTTIHKVRMTESLLKRIHGEMAKQPDAPGFMQCAGELFEQVIAERDILSNERKEINQFVFMLAYKPAPEAKWFAISKLPTVPDSCEVTPELLSNYSWSIYEIQQYFKMNIYKSTCTILTYAAYTELNASPFYVNHGYVIYYMLQDSAMILNKRYLYELNAVPVDGKNIRILTKEQAISEYELYEAEKKSNKQAPEFYIGYYADGTLRRILLSELKTDSPARKDPEPSRCDLCQSNRQVMDKHMDMNRERIQRMERDAMPARQRSLFRMQIYKNTHKAIMQNSTFVEMLKKHGGNTLDHIANIARAAADVATRSYFKTL